jgi:GxxExxY protein
MNDHSELTERIIGVYYRIYNKLGFGFVERVYHNAFKIELENEQIPFESEKRITIFYDKKVVGNYIADLVINDCLILELKAAENLDQAHHMQILNYLKSSNIELGLLLNFGKKPTIRRVILHNHLKQNPI